MLTAMALGPLSSSMPSSLAPITLASAGSAAVNLRVGAHVLRWPTEAYVAGLDVLELQVPVPRPKAGTLTQWRQGAPDLAVNLKLDDALWQAVLAKAAAGKGSADTHWLGQAITALKPECLVLQPGSSLTPSAQGRRRLSEGFAALRALGVAELAWQPAGVWEVSTALTFAAAEQVRLVLDPLATDEEDWETLVQTGQLPYLRVIAVGRQARISLGAYDRLLRRLEVLRPFSGLDRPIELVFEGQSGAKTALQFKRFAQNPVADF